MVEVCALPSALPVNCEFDLVSHRRALEEAFLRAAEERARRAEEARVQEARAAEERALRRRQEEAALFEQQRLVSLARWRVDKHVMTVVKLFTSEIVSCNT